MSGYFLPGLIADRLDEHAADRRAVGRLPGDLFFVAERDVALTHAFGSVSCVHLRGRRRRRATPTVYVAGGDFGSA